MSRRRDFIKAISAGCVTAASISKAEESSRYGVEDQRPFREQTRRLKLTCDGRYFAALLFPTDYPTHFRLKPEIFPVCTPKGVPVTGSHEHSFIHHQSVMCGHGKIQIDDQEKPYDFYRKLNFPEEERSDKWHKGFNLFTKGPSGIQRITEAKWNASDRIAIDLTLDWQTRERNLEIGETLLRERRRYEIFQRGNYTIIDHFTHLVPIEKTATLLADRHSFCGVRVNDLIDVEDGGEITDSEGRINGDGNFWDASGERKAPRWVDCTGKIASNTAGVALMGHPGNIRNQYYYRSFGLMEVSPCLGEDVAFTKENPFRFAVRYVAHDGRLDPKEADDLYEDFSRSELVH